MEFWWSPQIKQAWMTLLKKIQEDQTQVEWANTCHMLSPLYFTTERTWHIAVAGMCFVWNALLRIMYAMLYTFTAIYAGRRRSEWLHSSVTFIMHTQNPCYLGPPGGEGCVSPGWGFCEKMFRFSLKNKDSHKTYTAPQNESEYNWAALTFSIELVSSLMRMRMETEPNLIYDFRARNRDADIR